MSGPRQSVRLPASNTECGGRRVVTQAGQGEEPQEPDATMQFKVPASFRADETMQLRVSDIPAVPDISEGVKRR